MAVFNVRLPDELAAHFDAMAASHGGRSALLRGLIIQALRAVPDDVAVPFPREPTSARIEIRLTASDIGRLDVAASERGLKRTEWIVALLRRRLFGKSPPPQPDRALIAQSWRELYRIGINLNQAVRALNAATMVDSGLDLAREAARVASFQEEIDGQLRALGRALAGDVSYWDTPA